MLLQWISAPLQARHLGSLVPRLSPSLFLVRMCKGTELEGESLGGFDHVRTLMTRQCPLHIDRARTGVCPYSRSFPDY